MKIRVLTASRKGKLKGMAEVLATLAQNGIYKADKIPPDYSCENERAIIILITPSSIPNKADVDRFIQGLNRQRARNVAFVVDGKPEEIAPFADTIRKNDVNVVEPILYVEGGFPLFSKMSPADKATVTDWFSKVTQNLA